MVVLMQQDQESQLPLRPVKDVDSKQVSTLLKKQRKITNSTGEQSSGDRVVNRSLTNYVRSRNITFTSQRLKPYTRVYPFFDGINVSEYCFSKLINIQIAWNIYCWRNSCW